MRSLASSRRKSNCHHFLLPASFSRIKPLPWTNWGRTRTGISTTFEKLFQVDNNFCFGHWHGPHSSQSCTQQRHKVSSSIQQAQPAFSVPERPAALHEFRAQEAYLSKVKRQHVYPSTLFRPNFHFDGFLPHLQRVSSAWGRQGSPSCFGAQYHKHKCFRDCKSRIRFAEVKKLSK